ncbi:Do family serine endopeptidase [Flaviflagellibacter deserti]|uniref:Probable periplasmic serine endoprotease DegP-like n=1 Tax=Flaviflagellibacter deserti TaxID=2267266 RepID=A0ABV9YZ11_9HYPH
MQTDDNSAKRSGLTRYKSVLLGSAVALGITGFIAGETFFAGTQPASAQITQVQNLSRENNLQQTSPQQDQISFANIVETVKPAVVSVRVKTDTPVAQNNQLPGFFKDLPEGHPLRRFFDEYGLRPDGGDGQGPQGRRGHQYGAAQGSGFFITADGYIVTNNHVVENATEVEVVTDDGKTLSAKVIGTDPRTDLALLKTDAVKDHKFVSFGTGSPRVGDWVVAIGNPFGLGGSVTAGIVSARGRDIGAGPYDDFLQIDAAVNRGNSGGPTFNLKGEVVGVNTAIYSPSGGNVGIAFAVPSEVAQNVINDLRTNGAVTRGWLGVQIQPVTDDIAESVGLKEGRGAMVVEPQPGSPGTKAGIKAGDVIQQVNGKDIEDAKELSRTIAGMKPGSKADLKVWRDGGEKTISVELGTLPDEPKQASNDDDDAQQEQVKPTSLADLGVQLQRSDDGDGVTVADVDEGGPLADKLKQGDTILEVAGTKVSTPREVGDAVNKARDKGTRSVLLRVKSGQNTRYVAIPTKKG